MGEIREESAGCQRRVATLRGAVQRRIPQWNPILPKLGRDTALPA